MKLSDKKLSKLYLEPVETSKYRNHEEINPGKVYISTENNMPKLVNARDKLGGELILLVKDVNSTFWFNEGPLYYNNLVDHFSEAGSIFFKTTIKNVENDAIDFVKEGLSSIIEMIADKYPLLDDFDSIRHVVNRYELLIENIVKSVKGPKAVVIFNDDFDDLELTINSDETYFELNEEIYMVALKLPD